MADSSEARRYIWRRHPLLAGANALCWLAVVTIPLVRDAGGYSRASALTVLIVFGSGAVVSSVLLRRTLIGSGHEPSERPGSRLRRYIRQNHRLLYGADIAARVGLAIAWIWSLADRSHRSVALGVMTLFIAVVMTCFVLMVRRDPEDRL